MAKASGKDRITVKMYEENIGMVLMRTTIHRDRVVYEVVSVGGVVHQEVVMFSKRRGHEPGGRAFVNAANRQDKIAFSAELQYRQERRSWLESQA